MLNLIDRTPVKKVFITIIIGFLVYICIYGLLTFENETLRVRPKIFFWSNLTIRPDTTCRLPLDINPFDPSIQKFIVNDVKRIVCVNENTTFDWTYVDINGTLRKNNSISESISCEYQVYRRYTGNDFKNKFLAKGSITENGFSLKQINNNFRNHFVSVKCIDKKTDQKYYNNHYWFEPNVKKFSNSSGKPSVLILVIESLSRLNFLRHMKKTKKSFESYGNVFYLNGLTKMADNSFPNMVPFLTGLPVDHFGGRYAKGPFDDWPFIWKKYHNKGYVTGLMEDDYEISLFNENEINRKGFISEQPVDWYTYPFWKQLISTDKSIFDNFCYFDRKPRIEIFIEQLQHFLMQCKQNSLPYFMFNFYIQVTHVRFNQAQNLDYYYSKFFDQMINILNNDFIILMGDHGNRFGGEYLQTTIGRIEERMPLFSIHIPNKVIESNPQLSQHLISNKDKLVNWLDINLMLNDIIHQNYSSIKTNSYSSHSYSVWRENIPKNRTCAQALIPNIYCVCDERKPIDTRHELAVNMSLLIVKHINQLLPKVCTKLFMREVLRAEEVVLHSSVESNDWPNISKLYEMTINLSPSQAIIRSQIEVLSDKSVRIDEHFTRLNKYGNQSHCVTDSLHKKLCFCK